LLAPRHAGSRVASISASIVASIGGSIVALFAAAALFASVVFAQRLTEALGQPVIVHNRSGATGIIANELVAKSLGDGYTLLATPSSSLTSTPHLNDKLPYDALLDFVPVAQLSAYGYVLVVHPSVLAKTLRDLIALARARPGGSAMAHAEPAAVSISPVNCSRSWRRSSCCMCRTRAVRPGSPICSPGVSTSCSTASR